MAALRASARGSLLHVISHSGLGVNGGYLALADGKVSAADIVAWRIGPRLAVLPTCSSAATAGREMGDRWPPRFWPQAACTWSPP